MLWSVIFSLLFVVFHREHNGIPLLQETKHYTFNYPKLLLYWPKNHLLCRRLDFVLLLPVYFYLPVANIISFLWGSRGWRDNKEMNGVMFFSKEESLFRITAISAYTKIRGGVGCFEKENAGSFLS